MFEFRKEIKESHSRLSNCSLKFLDFVRNNPESQLRSNFEMLKWHIEPYILQPWPTFINQHIRNEISEASLEVYKLIKDIPKRIFANDFLKMSHYYNLPIDLVRFQLEGMDDDHLNNILARGDYILSPNGLKCLEYNVSANIGGWDLPIWESMYLENPIVSKFLSENSVKVNKINLVSKLLDRLIKTASDRLSIPGSELNIAVAMPPKLIGSYGVIKEYFIEVYRKKLESAGIKTTGRIIFCGYNHLKANDDYLYFRNSRVHILIELYHGAVPYSILNVFKLGNLCLYNGPITGLLSNKLNLALLSEYGDSGIYNEDERDNIRQYIPWSRKITSDDTFYGDLKIKLDDFILGNKDKLIIKPAVGSGGQGVCIGKKISQQQWADSVRKAIKERCWLVQECIESYPFWYQNGENGFVAHNVAWGFFILGTQYAGSWARVLPRENRSGVINCHQGAAVSVVFEIEE